MRRRVLIGLAALFLARNLAARDAADVVLGDTSEDCDCPVAAPPSTPPAAPTVTSTVTPEPVSPLKRDIERLGFPVQWEGETLLVTLADERTRFDTAQATLKPESLQRLDTLAAVLSRHPGNRIRVDGHTDGAGSTPFNQALSLRRAQAVEARLREQGVPAADFEAVEGHGPGRPVGDNATEEGRAMNRRVELRLRFHHLDVGSDAGQPWQPGTEER